MKFRQLYFFFLLLFGFFSCFQPVEVDDTNNSFPIQLRLIGNEHSTLLEWDKFNSSSFRKYILVRSTLPIASGLTPKSSSSISLIAEISNADITTHDDHLITTSPIMYYKVYVDVGNRFIESQAMEVKTKLHIFNTTMSSNNVYFNPKTLTAIMPHANMTDRSVRLFNITDYSLSISEGTVPIHLSGISLLPSTYYTDQQNKQAFYFAYNTNISKIGIPEMELSYLAQVVNVNLNPAYSIVCDDKFLLYAFRNTIDGTLVFTRENTTLLKKYASEFKTEKRLLVSMDESNHTFAEIAFKEVEVFSLDESGEKQNIEKITLNEQSDLLSSVVKSKDGKYLVFTKNGTIYNSNFEIVSSNVCTDCTNFIFANDGKHIYSIHNHALNNNTIRKYSYPEYALKKTLVLSNIVATFIPTDSGIGIFGSFSNVNGISFFKELNF